MNIRYEPKVDGEVQMVEVNDSGLILHGFTPENVHVTSKGTILLNPSEDMIRDFEIDTIPMTFSDGVSYEVTWERMDAALNDAARRYPEFDGPHGASDQQRQTKRYHEYMEYIEKRYIEMFGKPERSTR